MSKSDFSERKALSVEIVSPARNRRELTVQCLRSLARIDQTNLKIHIIIVDDGSTDGTAEAIEKDFPHVEIIRGDGSWWFGTSANRGFASALTRKPDYLLLLNDDTVHDENFLHRLIECAETNPRSIVGSLLLSWDAPHKVFQVAPRFEVWNGGWRHLTKQTVWTMPKQPFEVDIIVGNCILIPRAAFQEEGLLDEKRFPHFADAEFTPRLKRKGWRLLIEPRALVFNQPNSTTSLRKMTLAEMYQALWGNINKFQNIRSRYRINSAAAPTKIHALAATAIFVVRMGLVRFGINRDWATGNLPEKPLNQEILSK